MHFLGGLFLSLLVAWSFYRFPPQFLRPKTVKSWIITIMLAVFVIGFLWEVYEILVDGLTGAHNYIYLDGFSDMFNDVAGGFFGVAFLVHFFSRNPQQK